MKDLIKSDIDVSAFDFHAGDHIALAEDDWSLIGRDIILLDAEPVPGSTQCLIRAGDETRIVSRAALRHA